MLSFDQTAAMRKALKTIRPNTRLSENPNIEKGPWDLSAVRLSVFRYPKGIPEYWTGQSGNPENIFGLSECGLFPAATPLLRPNRDENPGRTNAARARRQSM